MRIYGLDTQSCIDVVALSSMGDKLQGPKYLGSWEDCQRLGHDTPQLEPAQGCCSAAILHGVRLMMHTAVCTAYTVLKHSE